MTTDLQLMTSPFGGVNSATTTTSKKPCNLTSARRVQRRATAGAETSHLALKLAFCSLLLVSMVGLARAQGFTVLHTFGGSPDGASSCANLIRDPQGYFYGTTSTGGAYNNGTVFKLSPGGTETVLYSFTGGVDGGIPYAGLIRDAQGNLYGTTSGGGAQSAGTVFKVSPSGSETVLHSFRGPDGRTPVASLIEDAQGYLYGTTEKGGAYNYGTVFKLSPGGTETVLHNFTGQLDGAYPEAALIQDARGVLYGTTFAGGNLDFGTVFAMSPTGTETVLHSFTGQGNGDGTNPTAGLVQDAQGNLYGTTSMGGGSSSGFGIVFEVSLSGTERVLHSFGVGVSGDGDQPRAGLIRDAQGNLYGTTYYGTTSAGTVFKVSPSGTETVLYRFTGGADGGYPAGGLFRDAQGNLYGTTSGGAGTVWCWGIGCYPT